MCFRSCGYSPIISDLTKTGRSKAIFYQLKIIKSDLQVPRARTHQYPPIHTFILFDVYVYIRGTQREYSSKPLKHCIVERILVFKR